MPFYVSLYMFESNFTFFFMFFALCKKEIKEKQNRMIARDSSTKHSAWPIKAFNQWLVQGEQSHRSNHVL